MSWLFKARQPRQILWCEQQHTKLKSLRAKRNSYWSVWSSQTYPLWMQNAWCHSNWSRASAGWHIYCRKWRVIYYQPVTSWLTQWHVTRRMLHWLIIICGKEQNSRECLVSQTNGSFLYGQTYRYTIVYKVCIPRALEPTTKTRYGLVKKSRTAYSCTESWPARLRRKWLKQKKAHTHRDKTREECYKTGELIYRQKSIPATQFILALEREDFLLYKPVFLKPILFSRFDACWCTQATNPPCQKTPSRFPLFMDTAACFNVITAPL